MNIIIPLHKYEGEYIFFAESVPNIVPSYDTFSKILFMSPIVTINNILIETPIISQQQTDFKQKYNFDVNANKDTINSLITIESQLLNSYKYTTHTTKTPKYLLSDNLHQGYIKTNLNRLSHQQSTLYLNLCGIWETSVSYGVVYKFVKV